MTKEPHLAFRQDNNALANRLVTEVAIYAVPFAADVKPIKVRALWDTGATSSVITHGLSRTLGLIPINRRKVTGVNNTSIVDVAKVAVELPNSVMLNSVKVSICKLTQDIDMLIGMDIILKGDFAISNAGGKTLFTFAIPPFDDKTDLYEKANAVNRRVDTDS